MSNLKFTILLVLSLFLTVHAVALDIIIYKVVSGISEATSVPEPEPFPVQPVPYPNDDDTGS